MLRAETAGDPARLAAALAGLKRYQQAPRTPPPPPMPAIAEIAGAALRDYGGAASHGPAILFVPSLINPPSVLDLAGHSLLRWLAGRGLRPLLLDWGWDVAARASWSVAGHVEQIVLPMIAAAGRPPILVGYCLGGTMALAASCVAPVHGVAAIAAPWSFSGFPAEARDASLRLWQQAAAGADALGALPMEVLQSAFWNLDPARTVAKFEDFATVPEGRRAEAFVALEDWANDGPPIPLAAARELFEDFIAADMPGTGNWQVLDAAVDPTRLACPCLNIVSTVDRIVPRETALDHGERIDLDLGHVGMIVGGRSVPALWEPLAAWLSRTAAS